MALVLRGHELIATEALSATILSSLETLAARQPLIINGVKLQAADFKKLAEEARQTGKPVWLGTSGGRMAS